MEDQDLIEFLEFTGKDPSRLIFEDELTGIFNRRFLFRYFDAKVPWKELEGRRLSLIMIDLDHFKTVNDTYGHQVGDQALVWFAHYLRKFAGEDGLPIRYAGDEFMLLLESSDKSDAMAVGQELVAQLQTRSFPVPDADISLQLTVSVGVATAPTDAKDWRTFVRQADMALYLAKKRGRDQIADAAQVNQAEIADKAAIYLLGAVHMVGRKAQLNTIRAALKAFHQKQSQFLIVEGAAGMGKTEFIDSVAASLTSSNVLQAKVRGNPQEMFRPYYLMESILIGLMIQREDRGAAVVEGLSPEERAYLSQILPGIGMDEKPPAAMHGRNLREGIFGTFVAFFKKAVGGQPFFLFIDDLHYADEGTLQLLRRLMLRGELRLFVVGTAAEAGESGIEEAKGPLERFVAQYRQELGVVHFPLTPLSAQDATQHMLALFPKIQLPAGFADDLIRISQGNPLFLAEILRKLVLDQRITLVGQQWTLHPVEEGYLPNSMEEIVTEKIAALDEESRHMLDQVSAMGEHVSLSMLIGSSDRMEARVLEFIEQAAAQGLLTSDFTLNDENVRFLGKRILEITYNAIEPERREQIHGKIGSYQEGLYERLQASAASLAYHFKRSDDSKKAEHYERIQAEANRRRFNAQEAADYSGDLPTEEPPEESPLSGNGLTLVPKLIRTFTVALRNIRLYPPGSKSVLKVNEDLNTELDQIFTDNGCLSLSQDKKALVINGRRMDTTDFKLVADSFIEILERFDLKGIAFYRGVSEKELEALTEELGRSEKKVFEEDHWERFSIAHGLKHIDLKQMRYTMQKAAPSGGRAAAVDPDVRMDAASLALIPEIVRALLSAARTIKLYPITSKASENAVDLLEQALRPFLKRYSLLTLSHVGSVLLVNGEKIDTSAYKALADGLLKYFHAIGLSSLTFLDNHTPEELRSFVGALGDLPPSGVDPKVWKNFAGENNLAGILFDAHMFEVRIKHAAGGAGPEQDGRLQHPAAAEPAAEPKPIAEPAAAPKPGAAENAVDALVENMPERISDHFLKGNVGNIHALIAAVFNQYPECDAADRERILGACRRAADALTAAYRYDLAQILTNPLLFAFLAENDPKIVVQAAALMHRLAAALIQFASYPFAARLLTALQKRQQELSETDSANAQILARNIRDLLHPNTRALLIEDFLSGNTTRQRNAAQLLAGFGPAAQPMLMDIIKSVDDYRTRHICVSILEKSGSQAGALLKRVLVQDASPEEKIRILTIIENLTREVEKELGCLLGDEHPGVRQAALKLIERLNDPKMTALLLYHAKGRKPAAAADAIACIGKIKPPVVVDDLIEILNGTKDEVCLKACCFALGEIAGRECIAPLSRVLNHKNFFLRRKKYSDDVRAAAAFALGQISHPEARDELTPHLNHPDPRIRQIAAEKTGSAPPPAPAPPTT